MNLADTTDSMEDSSCQTLIISPNAVTIPFNLEYESYYMTKTKFQFFSIFPDHVNFWLFEKNENFVWYVRIKGTNDQILPLQIKFLLSYIQ